MAQNQVFRGTARKITQWHGATDYWYHNTIVVSVKDGVVTLDSRDYRTATTKLAMNQVSNQFGYGFQVGQERGKWSVRFANGTVVDFEDGMTFTVAEARARAA